MEQFRVGDIVEVANSRKILETLDEDGMLEGLPFMPEMLEFCGQRFRLSAPVYKTCVESPAGNFVVRGFRGNNVWILDELRCSGSCHDGCNRLCILFWKSDWLLRVNPMQGTGLNLVTVDRGVSNQLKTVRSPETYVCQCTELVRATVPLSRTQKIGKTLADIRSGTVGVFQMLVLIIRYTYWKIILRFVPRHLVGSLTRTPETSMALAPGEMVEVKAAHEIVETLNRKGCNRGLRYDRTLNKFGGAQYKVSSRLERMISEPTGQMLSVKGTVFLEGAMCPCYAAVFGGCGRRDFVYWREIWLKRVTLDMQCNERG